MLLTEREISIPKPKNQVSLFEHISSEISRKLIPGEIPIRFVVTSSDDISYKCELGLMSEIGEPAVPLNSIFDFERRSIENTNEFNAVLLIPTGIGAEIGGHSGDGAPVARLLSIVCDNLITHPNVVNACDVNEMPENTLYVEGSIISRFMMGKVQLQKVRSNRVILVVDEHPDKFFHEAAINSASAARAAMGLNCPFVVKIQGNVLMRSLYSNSGRAVGRVESTDRLFTFLRNHRSQYDAIAISSVIEIPSQYHSEYFNDNFDMVNPWGGVEAMLTHAVSTIFDVPSAHAPMINNKEVLDLDVGIVDPRKSAEAVSTTNLHCVLKGLHKSPRVVRSEFHGQNPGTISAIDVSCLVIPDGCIGIPTLAALEQGIPVIAVKENKNRMHNNLSALPFKKDKLILVESYLEAVGVMMALKAGVSLESVRRPLARTHLLSYPQSHSAQDINPPNQRDLIKTSDPPILDDSK